MTTFNRLIYRIKEEYGFTLSDSKLIVRSVLKELNLQLLTKDKVMVPYIGSFFTNKNKIIYKPIFRLTRKVKPQKNGENNAI